LKLKALSSADTFCTPQDEVVNHQLNKSTLETEHKSITKVSRRDQSLNEGFNVRALVDATKMFNEGVQRRPRSSQGTIVRGRLGNKTRKVKRSKELSNLTLEPIATKDLKKGIITKYMNPLSKKYRSQSKNTSYLCKDEDLVSRKNGFHILKDFFRLEVRDCYKE
jgi:hypothetical protein